MEHIRGTNVPPLTRPRADTTPASPRTACRTAVLERNSTRLVDRARGAGVPITYLGITPLFAEARAYAGAETDWVISPVADLGEAVVPRAERGMLLRLADAGIDFPMTYIAHEVEKGRLALPQDGSQPGSQAVLLDQATAERAVGPLPPPPGATALAERLGHSSHRLLDVLAAAIPIAGAIVAAPFVLAGAAIAAVGSLALDPIVFGVIPAGPPVPGQPAAWYILARWDWEPAPQLTA